MFKVNKILIIFLSFVLVFLVGAWEVLHSNSFKNRVISLVNKYAHDHFEVSVDARQMEFNLFPVGVRLHELNIQTKDVGVFINEFAVNFNLIDSFKTKFTLDTIVLDDVDLSIRKSKKVKLKDEKPTLVPKQIIKKLIEGNKTFPIGFNSLVLKNLNLSTSGVSNHIQRADISIKDDKIFIDTAIYNLNLEEYNKIEKNIDSIEISILIEEEKLEIKKIKIKDELAEMNLDGFIYDYLELNPKLALSVKCQVGIGTINDYFDLSEIGDVVKGELSLNGELIGTLMDPILKTKVNISNVVTDFALADEILGEVSLSKRELRFEKMSLIKDRQRITLKKPFQFLDLTTNKFVEENIKVDAREVELTNALWFLRKNLDVLKGRINGEVEFELKEKSFSFVTPGETQLSDLKLVINNETILHIPEAKTYDRATFEVIDGTFQMRAPININGNKFEAVGSVKDKDISFSVINGEINLNDWGAIAGLDIMGRGKFDLNVTGTNDKANILIDTNLKKFSLMDYPLDFVSTNINIDLNKEHLFATIKEATLGKLIASGSALVKFEDLTIQSESIIKSSNIKDIKKLLWPIFKNLSFIPDEIWGDWEINTNISGKLNLSELVIKSEVEGMNNFLYDESFSDMKFSLSLEKELLSIDRINLKKNKGLVFGNFKFDLTNSIMGYDLNVKNIPLYEISNYTKLPLNLNGELNGNFSKDFNDSNDFDLKILLNDSRINSIPVGNSSLSIKKRNDLYNYEANVLDQTIKSTGSINRNNKKISRFEFGVKSRNPKMIFGLFRFVDLNDLKMTGAVDFNLKSEFMGIELESGSHELNIRRLQLLTGNVEINYASPQPNLLIKKGQIEKWDLGHVGRNFSFTSNAKGNFSNDYDLEARFKVSAEVLQIFNTLIDNSSGIVRGKLDVSRKGSVDKFDSLVFSKNLKLSSPFIPIDIDKTEFDISYRNKLFEIKKFKADLSKGSVSLLGTVSIKDIFPDVNLKVKMNSAYIPFESRSEVTLSGDLLLVGNNFPYNTSGNILIDKLSIRNDFVDFLDSDSVSFKKNYDYLPESMNKYTNRFFNFNINILSPGNIKVKNSLVDITLGGELNLTGGESNIHLLGDLSLANGYHFATFKNNEYIFKKLNVTFLENRKIFNPDLDVSIDSEIDKYKVNAKVSGPVNKFNIDLSSEPFLTKESILSLIAFGYTEDLSSNLDDKEKEAMTQAGVGSILFDSFKINEALKNELGLEVSLGSQITKEKGSYLTGKTSGEANVGKVRTATTVEIKKSITEEMNLSVSSTLGGSIGQRQSMNLNYNINEKVSIEGVYEASTSEEVQNISTGNSLGADLKFKWSFK